MSNLIKIIFFNLLLMSNISIAQMQLDWAKKFHGIYDGTDEGKKVITDDSGNVYMTGLSQASGTRFSCVTMKYNKFGDSVWTRLFNRIPGVTSDAGNDILIDDSGNVYVASNYLLKYDRNGNLIWTRFDSIAQFVIKFDIDHNIIIGGLKGGANFTAVKYTMGGVRLWKSTYPSSDAFLYDMDLDDWGNIILTGQIYTTTFYDYLTVKFLSNGNFAWARIYTGISPSPGTSLDIAYAVATDIKGNAYVTGFSKDEDNSYRCLTIKYDGSGNQVWLNKYPSSSVGNDLEPDSSGNVYLTGKKGSNSMNLKYDSSGNIVWTKFYENTNGFAVNRHVLILDSAYNVYITSNSTITGATDYAAVKYDSSGKKIYDVTYNNLSIGYDYVIDMAIDKKGNLYLTGEVQSGGGYAIATVKFSPIITNISANNIQPCEFKLEQNYPNPFNPVTNLEFGIANLGFVTLKVYDVLGNEVAKLVNEKKSPGSYKVEFNGERLPSGIYFYSLSVDGSLIDTKRMILLK